MRGATSAGLGPNSTTIGAVSTVLGRIFAKDGPERTNVKLCRPGPDMAQARAAQGRRCQIRCGGMVNDDWPTQSNHKRDSETHAALDATILKAPSFVTTTLSALAASASAHGNPVGPCFALRCAVAKGWDVDAKQPSVEESPRVGERVIGAIARERKEKREEKRGSCTENQEPRRRLCL